jgi:hypothetical protein
MSGFSQRLTARGRAAHAGIILIHFDTDSKTLHNYSFPDWRENEVKIIRNIIPIGIPS